MNAVRTLLAFIVMSIIAAAAFWFWVGSGGTPAQPAPVATLAPPAPQIADTGIELIKLTQPLQVAPAAVKPKLKLPPAVQADPARHVVEATRIEPSERPVTVTTVIDERTGEAEAYVVHEPQPWLDTAQRGDAGLYVGIRQGEPTVRAQARHQLLQVKAVKVGALASIDMPMNSRSGGPGTDAFVGIGAWVGW